MAHWFRRWTLESATRVRSPHGPLQQYQGRTRLLAHVGHTATIRVPRNPRQGTPGGSGRHDLWQVTVHTVTGAARQDPESVIVSSRAPTCPNPGASHARVLRQLETRLVTLASRQQLH